MNLTVERIEYHRNGISGIGFHVVLFTDTDQPVTHGHKMVGIVFTRRDGEDGPSDGYCAVMDRGLLAAEIIGMFEGPGNAWRGDHYEPYLREAIANHDRHPTGPIPLMPKPKKRP